jgi:hypothetical protein
MRTRAGPILCLPYSVELNDSFLLIGRQRAAREFSDMIVDQFDELIEECVEYPLVCAISLHPWVSGQPFRLKCLEQALSHCVHHAHADRVWFTTPGEVANYCMSEVATRLP